jgi:photosystem II stability/assembly factor-like uncharacterized protein
MRNGALVLVLIGCLSACGAVASGGGTARSTASVRPSPSEPAVRRAPGDPVRMAALTFADATHGWLLWWSRRPEQLHRTLDGGETWAPVGYPTGAHLDAVGFIDADHGFARGWLVNDPSGCNSVASSPRCRYAIYRTDDGGVTWSHVLVRPGIGALSIISSHVIFAVAMAPECGDAYVDACGGDVLRSDDGGMSWRVVWRSPTQLWSLEFADAETGYAVRLAGNGLVGRAQVIRTSDGGVTWNAALEFERSRIPSLEVSHGRIWVMSLPDGLCSMGGCGGYVLWRSDNGRSWSQTTTDPAWYLHPMPERPSFVGGPQFADADQGWISAGVGAGISSAGVLHSDDGGTTWRRWTVPPDLWNLWALAPIDGQTALMVATPFGSGPASLMKTTDGGVTWRHLIFTP